MQTLRVRPFLYFAMGIAVTVAAAWSMSAWRASAAVSADESTFVNVTPTRILDTRSDLGLAGPFVSAVPQDLQVTGSVPIAPVGNSVVVPADATGVILNVTVVNPTADGFVSVRPADAAGAPTTSSLNFKAGDIIPNSVTVQMPTAGADAGKIEITYDAFGNAGPATEMLIDVVGYTKNSGLASLQTQANQLQTQVGQLQTQVAAFNALAPQVLLEGDLAGGSLTGSYPNPGLADNSVNSSKVAPDSLTATDLGADSVTASEIAANAVEASEIAANAVGADELEDGTVGLSKMNAVIRSDVTVTGPPATPVVNGACTDDISVPDVGAPAETEALVLSSRQASGLNDGWIATGGLAAPLVPGFVNIRICNETAAPGQPPTLLVSFIALGP